MRYNSASNTFFSSAHNHLHSSETLISNFSSLIYTFPTINSHNHLSNSLLDFFHLSFVNKKVPFKQQLAFSNSFLQTSPSHQEVLDIAFILDGLSCHIASSDLYYNSTISFRFLFQKRFSDIIFGLFYSISSLPSFNWLSYILFNFLLIFSRWHSPVVHFLSFFPLLRRFSPLLSSISLLKSFISHTSVYIFCPGPKFGLYNEYVKPNSTIILFNYFPSDSDLAFFAIHNIRFVLCLAHRVVSSLTLGQFNTLNSSSINLVLVKTHDDLAFVNSRISSNKCIYTPQLKLENAELNIAVDMSILCYALKAEQVFFCFSTLYVDDASPYTSSYHRGLVQNFQFAWHPPYIQFTILQFFSSFPNFTFDKLSLSILRSPLLSYLLRI